MPGKATYDQTKKANLRRELYTGRSRNTNALLKEKAKKDKWEQYFLYVDSSDMPSIHDMVASGMTPAWIPQRGASVRPRKLSASEVAEIKRLRDSQQWKMNCRKELSAREDELLTRGKEQMRKKVMPELSHMMNRWCSSESTLICKVASSRLQLGEEDNSDAFSIHSLHSCSDSDNENDTTDNTANGNDDDDASDYGNHSSDDDVGDEVMSTTASESPPRRRPLTSPPSSPGKRPRVAPPPMIGQKLYAEVAKFQPMDAGKITDILLKLDVGELWSLLESETHLKEKIEEVVMAISSQQKFNAGLHKRSRSPSPGTRRLSWDDFLLMAPRENVQAAAKRLRLCSCTS